MPRLRHCFIVAAIMMRGLAEMNWDDITEYAPAIVCAVAMPLTYSIATGHRPRLHYLSC
jgi:xanthine/uracil/vitamin C permease (AzgA family)